VAKNHRTQNVNQSLDEAFRAFILDCKVRRLSSSALAIFRKSRRFLLSGLTDKVQFTSQLRGISLNPHRQKTICRALFLAIEVGGNLPKGSLAQQAKACYTW